MIDKVYSVKTEGRNGYAVYWGANTRLTGIFGFRWQARHACIEIAALSRVLTRLAEAGTTIEHGDTLHGYLENLVKMYSSYYGHAIKNLPAIVENTLVTYKGDTM